jgi:hypothetical protein
VLKSFPRTWYFPKWNLVTWHPRGVLDDTLADQIIAFIEMEECVQAAPFGRYVDLSGLTHVRLYAGHVFDIAKRRHRAMDQVKSAFWTDKIVTMILANMYETFMASATIKVRRVHETKGRCRMAPSADRNSFGVFGFLGTRFLFLSTVDDLPPFHRWRFLVIVQNGSRCRFAHFKLCAHFLQAFPKRVDLVLMSLDS